MEYGSSGKECSDVGLPKSVMPTEGKLVLRHRFAQVLLPVMFVLSSSYNVNYIVACVLKMCVCCCREHPSGEF